MKILQTLLVASLLTITASASAGLQSFDVNPNTGGAFGNDAIDNISTTFNDDTQRFTWEATVADAADHIDGFWLVVNNGPNPKSSDVNELAIMYGDLTSGVLSTYVYNGQNNANSISNPNILLQTDHLSTSGNSFSFDISTAAINSWSTAATSPDYTGVSFAEQIGIWFHFTSGSHFDFNGNGDITGYSFGAQGWYDVANLPTQVSAPSAIALFGLAFAGLTLVRRKAS